MWGLGLVLTSSSDWIIFSVRIKNYMTNNDFHTSSVILYGLIWLLKTSDFVISLVSRYLVWDSGRNWCFGCHHQRLCYCHYFRLHSAFCLCIQIWSLYRSRIQTRKVIKIFYICVCISVEAHFCYYLAVLTYLTYIRNILPFICMQTFSVVKCK